MVAIEDLKPRPNNPNCHPDDQLALLANILQKQGWRSPIVVSRRSGYIVKGHGRRMAALRIGCNVAPVDYQDYPSDESEMADLIADNQIASLANPDNVLIKNIISDIDTGTIDLTLTGFTEMEIADMMAPDIPETEQGNMLEKLKCACTCRNKAKLGQFWQVGPHVLAVVDLFTKWDKWLPYLKPGMLFLPYPGPLVALGKKSGYTSFLMVQPIPDIAGHLLDCYQDVHGKETIKLI